MQSSVKLQLPAVALSIKRGGEVNKIYIRANIFTNGDNVISDEVNSGKVKKISLAGTIISNGKNSKAISIEGGSSSTENLRIK